jgi:predicted PurR-regulated permease PerM
MASKVRERPRRGGPKAKSEVPHTRELQLGTPTRLRAFVLLGLTLIGIYVCVWLLLPFLPALAWALGLAIVFAPAHRWLEARLGNGNIAASVSTLLIGVLVVAPLLLIAGWIVQHAAEGAATVQAQLSSGAWRTALTENALIATVLGLFGGVDLDKTLEAGTNWLSSMSTTFVSGSVLGIVTLLLTFYLLFYFLRDRRPALNWLCEISPLSDAEMKLFFSRVKDMVDATVYGTLVVAVVQGTLGGLMFWLLGLPAPVLWGVVMGVLAVVPVLGAFIIWIPAALYLVLTGEAGKALILTAWGGVVIAGLDNLLYPILVKDQLRMHTVPAFIAILGGLILFGASGILLGPLIVTATMFFLEIWRVPIGGEDIKDGPS